MNEKTIQRALEEIARENTQKHAEPWPLIRARVEKEQRQPALRLSKRYVFVLVAVAVLTIAASAYYLLMDAGLQKADQAGLVAHLDQTAQPTVFAVVPAGLAATAVSQTQNGITVTLDWAYADALRVAWQMTISGLAIPVGDSLENYLCTPYVTTQEGVFLKPGLSQEKILSDQPGSPIVVTYVSYQNLDADKLKQLTLALDLTIGPCGNPTASNDWNLGTKPIPTPIPLIGTYHLNFQIPLNQGNTVEVNKTVEAGGVAMTLKSITVSPSYTIADFCYPKIQAVDLAGNMRTNWFWWLQGTTIQFDEEEPVHYTRSSYFSLPEEDQTSSSQQCQSVGFATSTTAAAKKMTISIATLQTVEYSEDYMSLVTQKNDLPKLAEQGIKIQIGWDGHTYWRILQKPANMSDAQANQIVEDFLFHTIQGPWTFTVENLPH